MRQSDLAYVRLREDIIGWAVKPGQPLSEVETANRLGISRTPVREAMQRLARENLVRVVPGKGAFVATVSLADVAEMFQLREALEPLASRIAAGKPDNPTLTTLLGRFRDAPSGISPGDGTALRELCSEMDNEISSMIENGRMQSVLHSIWLEARRIHGAARMDQRRILESAKEREAILVAIIDHNGDEAEAATRRHLARSFDSMLNAMRGLTGLNW